jgi:hypothetical protein
MKRKKSTSTKRRTAAPWPGRPALAQEHLNLAGPAMLEGEDNPRSARRPPEDASVQDPLLDWPED